MNHCCFPSTPFFGPFNRTLPGINTTLLVMQTHIWPRIIQRSAYQKLILHDNGFRTCTAHFFGTHVCPIPPAKWKHLSNAWLSRYIGKVESTPYHLWTSRMGDIWGGTQFVQRNIRGKVCYPRREGLSLWPSACLRVSSALDSVFCGKVGNHAGARIGIGWGRRDSFN